MAYSSFIHINFLCYKKKKKLRYILHQRWVLEGHIMKGNHFSKAYFTWLKYWRTKLIFVIVLEIEWSINKDKNGISIKDNRTKWWKWLKTWTNLCGNFFCPSVTNVGSIQQQTRESNPLRACVQNAFKNHHKSLYNQ